MKALVLREYMKLQIEEVPDPVMQKPDEMLVRIHAAAICGSDVHGMDGSTGRRIPPVIMGHEAAGEVLEAGPAVRRFRKGDRITFDSTIWCGECFYCRRGEVNLCENRRVLGVSCAEYRQDGAFAPLLVIPERIAYHLPEGMEYDIAALAEPVGVAAHAM
ncbi:MAG: alcohol dehydrogenase catalytic domain-containing protein, partial [Rectinemataceae bacterium]